MIIKTNKDGITIELHGREQLWALRAKVAVPLNTITDVRHEKIFQGWRKWEIRMPGTGAPKLLIAGSFWTEEGWDFLYIRRPLGFYKPPVHDALVIETNQNRYKRIIIGSVTEEAKKASMWWKTNRKTLA